MAAEQNPSLHIDTDWKKQAQEEKRRLAEQAEKAKAAGAPPSASPPGTSPASPASPSGAAAAGEPRGAAPAGATSAGPRGAASARTGAQRELPAASFATLVQTLVTQSLFYLGDLSPRGGEPMLNLDLAKHNIDLLGVLEEKTKGNLSPDEQRLIDAALYETRMRYVSVASQFIS